MDMLTSANDFDTCEITSSAPISFIRKKKKKSSLISKTKKLFFLMSSHPSSSSGLTMGCVAGQLQSSKTKIKARRLTEARLARLDLNRPPDDPADVNCVCWEPADMLLVQDK